MTKCLHYRRGPPVDPPGPALVSALSRRGPGRTQSAAVRRASRWRAAARRMREPQGLQAADSVGAPPSPAPPRPGPLIPTLCSTWGTLSPTPVRSPPPSSSGIPTTGGPVLPPRALPGGEASLTRRVSQQTCPQSLSNPRTKRQVPTAPGNPG